MNISYMVGGTWDKLSRITQVTFGKRKCRKVVNYSPSYYSKSVIVWEMSTQWMSMEVFAEVIQVPFKIWNVFVRRSVVLLAAFLHVHSISLMITWGQIKTDLWTDWDHLRNMFSSLSFCWRRTAFCFWEFLGTPI